MPARSGKLPRDGGALAAPQTSHDGGGGQSGTPGCITLGLLNKGGGGTSHDAAGSGGGDLRGAQTECDSLFQSFFQKYLSPVSQIMNVFCFCYYIILN